MNPSKAWPCPRGLVLASSLGQAPSIRLRKPGITYTVIPGLLILLMRSLSRYTEDLRLLIG